MILVLAAAGALFLDGGSSHPATGAAFGELAGGSAAKIVLVPTALPESTLNEPNLRAMPRTAERHFGVGSAVVLHAETRERAGKAEFAAPLRDATGVFFLGGDHRRILDRYAGTRFETELKVFLARGGIVGGSSAGAMVLGSYQAARPGVTGNRIVDGPSNHAGFALLPNALIDVHFTERRRHPHLPPILKKYPQLRAFGIDERTALIIRGDGKMEVVGPGTVTVFEGKSVRVLSATIQ